MDDEAFSIGIEEEYLLVDPETRALCARPPREFMVKCQNLLGPKVVHEFLQSQVEIGTNVCETIAEAREDLRHLRETVAQCAKDFGMRMIAASTHPWAHWSEQEPVDMERYRILGAEHRTLARRMAICGMHVHAGINDKNLRVDLMGQVTYFMPYLLALSTSSPFWEGHDTGLKAFRPIIIGDLPRSGFPEVFDSWSDWTELLDDLAATGMVMDPSKIWWDIRPSGKHPTLEIRICDICTHIADGLTIAALYQSILAYLFHLRRSNERRRTYRRILLAENKWRAMRYGVEAEMADFGKRKLLAFADLTDELVELLRPFAEDLGCIREVEHARTIARRGTSSDEQLRIFNAALAQGATEHNAQVAVVDWLIEESASTGE
ncbi:carboxylate-amine ligase [Aliiruegeria lutimaris]|uniref:Putative glutamate--cysteine ligase 2 n=1 Tax=Aliiruegeria lutimaris TaxID=571298 RepID=A0A1G9NB26_9RHOB|nr:carboxylate-amine ligase [Aliiruegeria lutimaris]SDL83583.1 carboxylate-amine ligase [Aliiruegeria lutimaris]